MEANDDAPEDVKRATSVERELKKGERDDTFEGYPRVKKKRERWRHCAKPTTKKKVAKTRAEEECCQRKKDRATTEASDRITVKVFGKPCTFPKLKTEPRHCLTKPEYLKVLSTAKRRCPPDVAKEVVRRVRPISDRTKELARPTRQRMTMTLQEGATRLPPSFIDTLIKTLEGETCLTPE